MERRQQSSYWSRSCSVPSDDLTLVLSDSHTPFALEVFLARPAQLVFHSLASLGVSRTPPVRFHPSRPVSSESLAFSRPSRLLRRCRCRIQAPSKAKRSANWDFYWPRLPHDQISLWCARWSRGWKSSSECKVERQRRRWSLAGAFGSIYKVLHCIHILDFVNSLSAFFLGWTRECSPGRVLWFGCSTERTHSCSGK